MKNPKNFAFGTEALERLDEFLGQQNPSKIFFLVDENTHGKCLTKLIPELSNLIENEIIELNAHENSKSPHVLFQLWKVLADSQADRQTLIINLGGGVVTDLGGFLAGTYLRGLRFVNVPTSLLAMVDASSGGKNGINLDHLKNRVGLFLEPDFVCVWPEFLETLPKKELRSGFAEMLKHGLIADENYLEKLFDFDIRNDIPDGDLILKSIEIKKQIVDADFRESGERKKLNFGHTIGHAIESAAMEEGNPILHGEAVALGMMAEILLSEKCVGLPNKSVNYLMENIDANFYDVKWDFDENLMMDKMYSDKKNVQNSLRFSLLKSIGNCEVNVKVSEGDVREILKEMTKR